MRYFQKYIFIKAEIKHEKYKNGIMKNTLDL